MPQDDEDVEDSEGQGGHGEEIARDETVVHPLVLQRLTQKKPDVAMMLLLGAEHL